MVLREEGIKLKCERPAVRGSASVANEGRGRGWGRGCGGTTSGALLTPTVGRAKGEMTVNTRPAL